MQRTLSILVFLALVACHQRPQNLRYEQQGQVLILEYVKHLNQQDALLIKTADGKVGLYAPNKRFNGLIQGDHLYISVLVGPHNREPLHPNKVIFAKSPLEIK